MKLTVRIVVVALVAVGALYFAGLISHDTIALVTLAFVVDAASNRMDKDDLASRLDEITDRLNDIADRLAGDDVDDVA